MGNAQRGEVEILIGGTVYLARFDFDAIMCLETYFGSVQEPKPLRLIFQKNKEVPASMVPVVLWSTLRGRYPEEFPTVQHLTPKLDLTKLKYYSEKVKDIFTIAQQVMADDKPRPPVAAVSAADEPQTTA